MWMLKADSPLLIRVEDVVLALHRHMACVPAVGGGGVSGKLTARGIVVEQGVSPAARRWKPSAVLFDDECLREDIRHIHDEGGLRALLRLPLQLRDLGPFREGLAVAGNASLVGVDHRRVGYDDLEYLV